MCWRSILREPYGLRRWPRRRTVEVTPWPGARLTRRWDGQIAAATFGGAVPGGASL